MDEIIHPSKWIDAVKEAMPPNGNPNKVIFRGKSLRTCKDEFTCDEDGVLHLWLYFEGMGQVFYEAGLGEGGLHKFGDRSNRANVCTYEFNCKGNCPRELHDQQIKNSKLSLKKMLNDEWGFYLGDITHWIPEPIFGGK